MSLSGLFLERFKQLLILTVLLEVVTELLLFLADLHKLLVAQVCIANGTIGIHGLARNDSSGLLLMMLLTNHQVVVQGLLGAFKGDILATHIGASTGIEL